MLYLAIHYWSFVSGALMTILGAGMPIVCGLAIAYILNILLGFYERNTFARITSRKIDPVASHIICMTAALITAIGIIALIIGLVIPELKDCIKFLISEIPALGGADSKRVLDCRAAARGHR